MRIGELAPDLLQDRVGGAGDRGIQVGALGGLLLDEPRFPLAVDAVDRIGDGRVILAEPKGNHRWRIAREAGGVERLFIPKEDGIVRTNERTGQHAGDDAGPEHTKHLHGGGGRGIGLGGVAKGGSPGSTDESESPEDVANTLDENPFGAECREGVATCGRLGRGVGHCSGIGESSARCVWSATFFRFA